MVTERFELCCYASGRNKSAKDVIPPKESDLRQVGLQSLFTRKIRAMSTTVVPDTRNDEWTNATDKAKEAVASAGQMARHAVSASEAMACQAASDVGQRANNLTARVGSEIHEIGDSMERSMPHSGVLGAASQAVAESVKSGGEYLEDAKLSGMVDDVASLIRKNPIPSVLISMGIGWFVARKLWK